MEAAARHLSYSRAAEELSLTHGAVSHHIAKLEAVLETRLFVREGQRMVPTPVARTLAAAARQGLSIISDAFEAARLSPRRNASSRADRPLVVSVLPSFAARWLLPRLPDFQRRHPAIEIHLQPNADIAKLDGRDGVDLALRYGTGGWSGVEGRRLMSGWVFPVASPDYIRHHQLRTPKDLKRATLLRKPGQPWTPWFAAAGLDWPEPSTGPSYDDAGLILDAAAQGQGVALGRAALLEDDLAGGRLARIGDIAIEDEYAWYVVWREHRGTRRMREAEIFRHWVIEMAGASPDLFLISLSS
ncbi:MAG: LysR family transcriptional regulator [Sphingomonas sp.]|nr:LysR family transcriptional regulator [Sphingomonas sp.]